MAAPPSFSLKDIESVTNNFDDSNIIGEGFLGKIYEGQLSVAGELTDVAVRRLDRSFCLQEVAFDKEISILSRFKHENMVSIVGFCYENNEMLIINKRVARGSLRRHLRNPTLTWMRRLQISIGVVRALTYLHNDVGHNFSVIHHNINSNSILLDENWEAKISDFEYAMTIPAGDLDLAYEKLGIGTYKSDVFSVGIVLFELLCGREAFMTKDNNNFQDSLAIFHYENRKLNTLIDSNLFSQMDLLSFNIFSETAYYCLIDQRAPPTMNQVLRRLERALKAQQMHDNNEHSTTAGERTFPDHLKLKLKNLEHMRVRLSDILFATKNFDPKYCIVSGGYGSVYTAELDHVDKGYSFAIEEDNEHEVPKKRSTVAIKRIIDTENEIAQQGFYAEIEILMSCKHPNLISLLGFCYEDRAMILIYEYASNGSLNYYLQNMNNNHNDNWVQRVKICLNVAKGLSFLHTAHGDRQEIVHRDIKSANILLDRKFEAKIGDFGLSVFLSGSEEEYTWFSKTVAGTAFYIDPQYSKDAKLKKESDIYSFGVVMFEILCGTLAYDPKYAAKNKGLVLVARQHSEKETISEMVDPKIKEDITKTMFTSAKGPNQESLDTFIKIAYKCLAEAQNERPTMEVVVKELEKALFFEENRKDVLQIPLKDLQLATDNFSDGNCIGKDGFWKAYRGEVSLAEGYAASIGVKRFFVTTEIADAFTTELKILIEHKHENIISLLGYCEEGEEKIIVYEHALNGRLDEHLDKASLTWGKRLKICIDIASGLDFLHGGSMTGEVVILRDFKSMNILLDGDRNAKIASFGLSAIHPVDQETFVDETIVGTDAYIDPEYWRTGLLSKECDIYSFGVVLFEILLKRLAYSRDSKEQEDHLGALVKDLYKEGKLDDLKFEGTDEQIAPQSLTIFRRIAFQCLNYKREERPTAGEVIVQLKQALKIQEKGMDIVKVPFEDIKYATDDFSDEKCIGRGKLGKVYKGQLPHANGQNIIAAKRWDGKFRQGDTEFYQELEILLKFKHENVIGLEGYCDEMGEKIVVYEYASNSSLDNLLTSTKLTWKKRLEIGIDVATGLEFLHGGVLRREGVLHRNIKSSNILLSSDWKAKITGLGLSLIRSKNHQNDNVNEEARGNIDPSYMDTGIINEAADIYSFGVVLFDLWCGRSARPSGSKLYKFDDWEHEGIKEQVASQSLSTFLYVASKCSHDDPNQRPTASEVVVQLKKALEFQVDYEIWEPKLPSGYKEIFLQSGNPEICNTKKKEDLYNMLYEGFLIQKGKVWFSLGSNNQRNEMLSATLFTYQNQSSQKWTHNRKSRFQRVSLMTDVANLQIQAHIKAQFLTPSVVYGVYLVFKFAEPNKISCKPKYVNLKYKMGNETLHAYFATWRKDKWMMAELYRFLNDKDDGSFEFLLESFSPYYCGNGPVYIEGIEFRAIDNVTNEDIEKLKDAQLITRSNSNICQKPFSVDNDEIFELSKSLNGHSYQLSEINGKESIMFSAKNVLRGSSMEEFDLTPSLQSRFGEVIEVLSEQVFRINCIITNASKLFLPYSEYECYLIFKLSEKCRGLHCPVKVRGPLQRSNKVIKTLYVRTPNAWNIHDINQVPKQREDGWMEVNVWKFNSDDELIYDFLYINMKLISYEGTMSGLIVCGLEFRPM